MPSLPDLVCPAGSLPALKAANPGLDDRNLQVGRTLTIPAPR